MAHHACKSKRIPVLNILAKEYSSLIQNNTRLRSFSSASCLHYSVEKPVTTIATTEEGNSAEMADIDVSKKVKNTPESIWVKTVEMVLKYKPTNLGQGFPTFPVPAVLGKALQDTQLQEGNNAAMNQYTRGQGHPRLVQALAQIYSPLYDRDLDPMKNFIVTAGAYEGLYNIINAIVDEGDEVVVIEPFFDCYAPMIRLAGGKVRFVTLKMQEGGTSSNDFKFDEEEMRRAFTDRTKAIIVNTPHNPTGKIFSVDEMTFIGDLCKQHNALYISDEVYEWLVYSPNKHVRAATLPGMWDRTVTVCSAGKTFNVTGWKIGWSIGPEKFISAMMAIHSQSIYTCATPLQEALATMFEHEHQIKETSEQSYWAWQDEVMTEKKQTMFDAAKAAGLDPIMPDGGYFMVANVSDLGVDIKDGKTGCYDTRLAEWLIKEKGICVIPCSAFYSEQSQEANDNFIRFCFIKDDTVLSEAAAKLKLIKQ